MFTFHYILQITVGIWMPYLVLHCPCPLNSVLRCVFTHTTVFFFFSDYFLRSFSVLQPDYLNLYNLTQKSPPPPEFVPSHYLCSYEFELSDEIIIIATPHLVFAARLIGRELSPLHLLSHLYIEFYIFSSVLDMLIKYSLTLHVDFMFSERMGHVFLIHLYSPSTIHTVFGVVPGLFAHCQLTDKILIKAESVKYYTSFIYWFFCS